MHRADLPALRKRRSLSQARLRVASSLSKIRASLAKGSSLPFEAFRRPLEHSSLPSSAGSRLWSITRHPDRVGLLGRTLIGPACSAGRPRTSGRDIPRSGGAAVCAASPCRPRVLRFVTIWGINRLCISRRKSSWTEDGARHFLLLWTPKKADDIKAAKSTAYVQEPWLQFGKMALSGPSKKRHSPPFFTLPILGGCQP